MIKKNSKIHLRIESEDKNKLMKEALENDIPLNELCRMKLKVNSQLDRIERMLEEVLRKFN